jgi:molybdate transport system substrate-binding protein
MDPAHAILRSGLSGRSALLGALLAALLTGCGSLVAESPRAPATDGPGATRVIRVAAAADLRFAMEELAAAWGSANPDVRVEPVYGSSGNFFAQISQGAPFDLYFSADAAYPRELERAGLAEPGSTRLYAIGQIVIWVPGGSTVDVAGRGLEALADAAVRSVAIANPEHAPYGRAAVAAMEAAGVYEAVAPKLVLGENVAQAAQFVESGNADAGVIALSLALAPALREAGRHAIVPIELYPPLEQGAIIVGAAAEPEAAQAFLDFVLGPEGRQVLGAYGFLAPEP